MTNEIYFSELPDRLIETPIKSEHGINQSCYFVKETKEVFKRVQSSIQEIRRYRYFSHLRSDVFVFPETLVFKGMDYHDPDLELLGYLTPFIEGTPLCDLDRNVLISDIANALESVGNALYTDISGHLLNLNDANLGNQIYTPDKTIKIIDTDLYDYSDFDEPAMLHPYNAIEYNMDIIPFLFKTIQCCELQDIPLAKKINQIFVMAMEGTYPPSTILEKIKEVLDIEYKKEHKTMSDIDNSLALIRKKV